MTAQPRPRLSIPGVLLALYRYVRPFRLRLIPVLFACLLEMGLTAQIPLSIKYLIDRALVNKDGRALVIILTALAGICRAGLGSPALGGGAIKMRNGIIAQSSPLAARGCTTSYKISRSSTPSRRQTSEILSSFSSDLHSIELALISAVGWGLQPVLDIILSLVLVFTFEWRLALIGTLLCPICALGPRLLAYVAD